MLRANWNLLGVAVLAVLAIQSSSSGQQPTPAAAHPEAQFRTLTEADGEAALAEVKTAAAALDQRFASAGATADGWKEYLNWAAFEAELKKAKPDPAALVEVLEKLAAGNEGLELKSFADLRTALGDYVFVVVPNPNLEAESKQQITELSNKLSAATANPSSDETREIADHLLWLKRFRQAPELITAAQNRFASPNFQVHIGKELLDRGVGGPVDEVAPISDVILGTSIYGTGRTVGETLASVSPDPRFATFDANLAAFNYSNTVGRNGPVCIYATGTTGLAATKRFWIDDTGIHVYPAAASAQASTSINNIVSIKGRALVEKIAWRRAGQQKGEAECIAGQHAAGNLGARVNAQADPQVQNANERFEAKVRKPLEARRAYPRALSFSTLASGLQIAGIAGSGTQLAAPSAPPALTQHAEMSVYIHESMLNNLAANVFSGMRLTDEMAQRTAVDLTGSVPEKLKSDPNQEPFTIQFPPERIPRVDPVTVTFADNGFIVTLRGVDFASGDRHQRDTNITASYKFVKTPDGYKAVRQGDLEIYNFGQKPGAKRSFRQQGLYTALQAKFGKIFGPEMNFQGFKFAQGRIANAGQFVPSEIISQNGWLAIGYAPQKPSGTTAANN